MKNIFAICGSTKASSTNQLYIKAIGRLLPTDFNLEVLPSIADIPHFNPDLDIDPLPESVIRFRNKIERADGILICTPEYAMGLPGSLKNVLDWTVSSASISKKPVLSVIASSQGEKAFQSLIDILTVIEAEVFPLLISFAKTKINDQFNITDKHTLESLHTQITDFVEAVNRLRAKNNLFP
ncbi:NADPH-dependent FMN reductase [Pedobacter punctiformis]|uniref:NAD(P)H-dependent oxidoreductase n=1 Tax=Pedobacter punctiformis TaxID=3004097 RepID=A0ABT4L4Q9_9SPHI|nr:NADPH-dependent FMN reductase [Pedobacter sp. HCMS5-2]MCZ4242893.1 NAD(P)H-dependent oxidoreductase [Pedobacter sp. HCMS5-2]